MAHIGQIRKDNWVVTIPVADTYTIMEASQILGRGNISVRDLVSRGRLEKVIVGGKQHISHDAILNFLASVEERKVTVAARKVEKAAEAKKRVADRELRTVEREAKKLEKLAELEEKQKKARAALEAAKEAAAAKIAEGAEGVAAD